MNKNQELKNRLKLLKLDVISSPIIFIGIILIGIPLIPVIQLVMFIAFFAFEIKTARNIWKIYTLTGEKSKLAKIYMSLYGVTLLGYYDIREMVKKYLETHPEKEQVKY